MYWQYTTALALSVLAARHPAINNVDKAIESFISASLFQISKRPYHTTGASMPSLARSGPARIIGALKKQSSFDQ
jgi:hypothetical protein